MQRLQSAIDQFNGALLCDDVGMGKTYVALAVARKFPRRLIVVPAGLVPMWRKALVSSDVDASLVTFEALSRADLAGERRPLARHPESYDLVVVDEAHHVRNQRTNRYLALESLVRGARVLLLSATPIHNQRRDLAALLSLFLGSRAHALTSGELALCVIRREQHQLRQRLGIPAIRPVTYHDLPDNPVLVQRLLALPPPLPLRDAGIGGSLIGRGLIHQLASSGAALRDAVKRRIARATALCSALEAGTYPTTRELETWIYADDALQLGFAELLSAPAIGHQELLRAIRPHLAALEKLRADLGPIDDVDDARASIIATIRDNDPGASIVAFTQYSATASMLFRKLARAGRVALLTSHGARVAGGSLTRADAIARFAPIATGARRPSRAEAIELLLTTDLLSEGVNLQDARVVIHLDIPWTAARMEQRVGRVARLGSRHTVVTVHVLRPPRSAADLLDSEMIVRRKWGLAKHAIGTSSPRPDFGSDSRPGETEPASAPTNAERLRVILERWLAVDDPGEPAALDTSDGRTIVATVLGSAPGFVAAISVGDVARLLVGSGDRVGTDLDTQIDACSQVSLAEGETTAADIPPVLRLIDRWFAAENAAVSAGLSGSSAQRRRTITSRIDAAIASAPPHLRASRLLSAGRARAVATAPQCGSVERELDELTRSAVDPDAWLAAVANLGARQAGGHMTQLSRGDLTIHAVLIERVKPRRSPSPPAPESP
ncbi:MAG TPA: helicase-related protein [Gemmatimonadaceae bacterium]|nr:helicase-related protein [Gemmatimonadaceae bacterium]